MGLVGALELCSGDSPPFSVLLPNFFVPSFINRSSLTQSNFPICLVSLYWLLSPSICVLVFQDIKILKTFSSLKKKKIPHLTKSYSPSSLQSWISSLHPTSCQFLYYRLSVICEIACRALVSTSLAQTCLSGHIFWYSFPLFLLLHCRMSFLPKANCLFDYILFLLTQESSIIVTLLST